MEQLQFYLLLAILPLAQSAVPGIFFWKPRLGVDLALPTTEASKVVHMPTKENFNEGVIVLIDGYQAGATIVALAAGISDAGPFPTLNPFRGYFYTNVYRWGLRHFSMMPYWLGGNKGSYCDTHKVWKRRFYYMDEFLPPWLRKFFPYVPKGDWEKEIQEYKRYKKFSESAFAKFYKYPSKSYNNFTSMETTETEEDMDSASSSFLSQNTIVG